MHHQSSHIGYLRGAPLAMTAALLLGSLSGCSRTSTASTAVSHFVAFTLPSGPSNSTFVPIGDLAGQNSDSSDHQIIIRFTGRILAVAQVHISNPGGIGVRGACELLVSDGTGPQNGLSLMSGAGVGGRTAVWFTINNAAYDLTVPVVGYATKPPGTYNVVVKCEQLAFDGATAADLNQLIVWAIRN